MPDIRAPSFSSTSAASQWQPSDYGIITWSFDPSLGAATGASIGQTGGTRIVRLKLASPASVTNIIIGVTSAGSVLTASQCIAGIYQGGTLIASTGDQSGTWNSTGLKIMPLTGGPFAVTAGEVVAAFYANGTTGPSLLIGNGFVSTAFINANLGATASRYGLADTGRTTTLAGTLGTVSATSGSFWVALS